MQILYNEVIQGGGEMFLYRGENLSGKLFISQYFQHIRARDVRTYV